MFSEILRVGVVLKKRLKNRLSGMIPSEELDCICNSYDVIGDIAIVRLTERSKKYDKMIAEEIMNIHKNIKTVFAQISPVHGDFRLRELVLVAGEDKATTLHKEFGCFFSVDVKECYFSPRLLFERMRIAEQIETGEVVVNMFAGVGCFSVIIAKHSEAEKIYSIDVNPMAFRFMRENVRLNRVEGKVVPKCGDAKDIIEKELHGTANRVLMPLPEKALEYLPYAFSALKNGRGWIHCYLFEHAEKDVDPVQKAKCRVSGKLGSLGVAFEFASARIVRTTGPRWYHVVLDIHVISGDKG